MLRRSLCLLSACYMDFHQKSTKLLSTSVTPKDVAFSRNVWIRVHVFMIQFPQKTQSPYIIVPLARNDELKNAQLWDGKVVQIELALSP